MRPRPSTIVLSVLLVAVTGALALAAARAWTAPHDPCNNEIGECINGHQLYAIEGISIVCWLAAFWTAWSAIAVVRRMEARSVHVVAAVIATVLALTVLIVDPASHLNHYSGWLTSAPD